MERISGDTPYKIRLCATQASKTCMGADSAKRTADGRNSAIWDEGDRATRFAEDWNGMHFRIFNFLAREKSIDGARIWVCTFLRQVDANVAQSGPERACAPRKTTNYVNSTLVAPAFLCACLACALSALLRLLLFA